MKKIYFFSSFLLLASLVAFYGFLTGKCSLLRPDQRGYRAFGKKDFATAASTFRDPMWRGAAFFKDGKFKEAAAIYSGYDMAEAVYNQGNCLVMLGKYEDAVKSYLRALELRPNWQIAAQNLKIAQTRADRLKKEGGEMTGGKLEADEIVFDNKKTEQEPDTEENTERQKISDVEMRAMWLHNVHTKPADFLRAKFSYQLAIEDSANEKKARENDMAREKTP